MLKKNCIVRALVLLLAAVLCAGAFSVAAFATEEPANRMRAPEDVSGLSPEECEAGGFWGQYSIQRRWVRRIEFRDTTWGAPEYVLNFSEVWKNQDVIGWYKDNVLYIAANGKITLNRSCAWMFACFRNLEEIAFNGCVDTSLVENMDYMFYECRNLESVDVDCFDTSNVKSMKGMFYECKNLRELDVSNFNTAKVKNMCRMFAYCERVKKLDVRKFDTSRVTDMSFLFYCCKELKELDVSGFDTSENLYLNSMFYGCEKLETVDVSKFDTSRTMGMCYTFYGCKNLKTPDVDRFDVSRVLDYRCFMDKDVTVNGQPWEQLFRK